MKKKKAEPKTLWGGRFKKGLHPKALDFSESISFDHELALYDIEQSIAHVQGLKDIKLLKPAEEKLIAGLKLVRGKFLNGTLALNKSFEDIHTAIEKELTALVGDVGGKLHTARSRNDQVVTDLKLYLRAQTAQISSDCGQLIHALCKQSKTNAKTILPGYTHLQRAMPVTLSHHLLAYAHMFYRDAKRFKQCAGSLSELPLGSGALAGSNHNLSRLKNAKRLGFARVTLNSLDAVSDRDFLVEFLSACAITQMHLSRLSEDLILWASQEFSFLELDDSFSTGSSLMPQKKNPDMFELTRGKAARTFGNLMSCLTLLKGLPLSYNRDLQEDKIFAFDSARTVSSSLQVMSLCMNKLRFNKKNMAAAVEKDLGIFATDLADILVKQGVPFRQTHEVVGRMVQDCVQKNKRLSDLSDSDLRTYHESFPKGSAKKLRGIDSVMAKAAVGGPHPKNSAEQIRFLEKELKSILKKG